MYVQYVWIFRFVISKEWWDKWCNYTGYSEDNNDGNNNNNNNKSLPSINCVVTGAGAAAMTST